MPAACGGRSRTFLNEQSQFAAALRPPRLAVTLLEKTKPIVKDRGWRSPCPPWIASPQRFLSPPSKHTAALSARLEFDSQVCEPVRDRIAEAREPTAIAGGRRLAPGQRVG